MIEFKIKYDKKTIEKSCRVAMSQILIPLIVIAVGFFGYSIFNFVKDHYIIGLIWLVLSIVYIPLLYFVIVISQIAKYDKMYLKETKQGKVVVDTYQFDEDSVLLSTDLDNKNISKIDTDYKYFVKVKETKNDFILFKTGSAIFVLPKDKITVGTVLEFEKLLAEKFGDKFKNKTFKDDVVAKEEQNQKTTETPVAEEIPTTVEETPVVEDVETTPVEEHQTETAEDKNTDATNNE